MVNSLWGDRFIECWEVYAGPLFPGNADDKHSRFHCFNNMGGCFSCHGYSIYKEQVSTIMRTYLRLPKEGWWVISICQMAFGSKPLGLTLFLWRGPNGASGVHVAQDLVKCLHCVIDKSGRSLCMFSGERWNCWSRALACSSSLRSTVVIIVWVLSLPRARLPGGLAWDLIWEISQGNGLLLRAFHKAFVNTCGVISILYVREWESPDCLYCILTGQEDINGFKLE